MLVMMICPTWRMVVVPGQTLNLPHPRKWRFSTPPPHVDHNTDKVVNWSSVSLNLKAITLSWVQWWQRLRTYATREC